LRARQEAPAAPERPRDEEREAEVARREARLQALEAELHGREAELTRMQGALAARQEELRRRERRLEDAERVRERAALQPVAPYVSFSEGLDALAGGSEPDRRSW
jgi:uncharacterized protein (DUF3084 family)